MYRPKIKEEWIRMLYEIKQQTGVSIAQQVNEVIQSYLALKQMDERMPQLYDEWMKELGVPVDDEQA